MEFIGTDGMYVNHLQRRVEERVVGVAKQVNNDEFLSLRYLANAFFERFEVCLCIMPVASSEVWFITNTPETIERLQHMEIFVDGWIEGRKN